jgi:hypothetical protein
LEGLQGVGNGRLPRSDDRQLHDLHRPITIALQLHITAVAPVATVAFGHCRVPVAAVSVADRIHDVDHAHLAQTWQLRRSKAL